MTVTNGGDGGRVPCATYRLQFHGGTTFTDAAGLVDYLADLGVSDLYASPIMDVPEGAGHGYHILDPNRVDPQLGGDRGLGELHEALRRHGLGLLLDIVPNHLAASPDNPYWRDVLTHGRHSPYAAWFDIDWDAADGVVVLPVLGRPLDDMLDVDIRVLPDGPALDAGGVRLPLAPETHDLADKVAAKGGEAGALRDLLSRQHYRLVYWRTGVEELNYRRFFDITDLVGVRVEDPAVFDARHERLLELVADGVVTGLRVDHVDGLRDPLGYLSELTSRADRAADGASVYVVVEKIVEGNEPLPDDWPVGGTTGYELLNAVNAAFVDGDGLRRLGETYRDLTGIETPVVDIVHARKTAALRDLFHGEVHRLARRLERLSERIPGATPVTVETVRDVLVAVTACFPVYRTYLREDAPAQDGAQPSGRDRMYLEEAFAEARRRHADLDGGALVFVERVLGFDVPVGLGDDLRHDWLDVVLRWQQLTGPAMAKGFEDTTFYIANRLASLNEVGVDADGIEAPHGLSGFHERVGARATAWPHAMNATSTHDTKRSEDVRARLAVLSEIPGRYERAVRGWFDRHAHLVRRVRDHDSPDANERWLLYQTLVGMWPLDPAEEGDVGRRLRAFIEKAAREAKVNTTWLDPDAEHEEALRSYVDGVLEDTDFVDDLRRFVDGIAAAGAARSLAQVVVKIAAPGVPDFYQGTELWDLSLVDPDNRRPVDWDRRRRALAEIRAAAARDRGVLAGELVVPWRDGRVKLYVTWAGLHARRRDPDLFLRGDYTPLDIEGQHAGRLLAFARRHATRHAVIVVPTRTMHDGEGAWPLGEAWGNTRVRLPDRGPDRLRDVFTGATIGAGNATVRVADLLRDLPVSLTLG